MYKIDVEKQCGCIKKSDLTFPIEVENEAEAKLKALELANMMNKDFCKKHRFAVNQEGENFIISVEMSCNS